MFAKNFVYFFTVQGFFLGIIFGILNSLDAKGLLVYTFFITTFFYLFSYIMVSIYFKTLNTKSQYFSKDKHELELNIFTQEMKKQEKLIDSVSKMNANHAGAENG